MFEWLPIVTALLSGSITAAGFLLSRKLTKAPQRERAEHFRTLTEAAVRLREGGMTPADVADLESYIGLPEGGRVGPEAARLEAFNTALPPAQAEPHVYWTQRSMNDRALAAYRTADAAMQEVATSLATWLGHREREALNKAQSAWESYRKLQADFASCEFEGGTIQPLLHSLEMRALTQARQEELQAEISKLKSRADTQAAIIASIAHRSDS